MTDSEEHAPERREDQRRQIAQPAYYGENRTAVRRTDDGAGIEVEPAEHATVKGAIPHQDYEFLTGLISMEHSG